MYVWPAVSRIRRTVNRTYWEAWTETWASSGGLIRCPRRGLHRTPERADWSLLSGLPVPGFDAFGPVSGPTYTPSAGPRRRRARRKPDRRPERHRGLRPSRACQRRPRVRRWGARAVGSANVGRGCRGGLDRQLQGVQDGVLPFLVGGEMDRRWRRSSRAHRRRSAQVVAASPCSGVHARSFVPGPLDVFHVGAGIGMRFGVGAGLAAQFQHAIAETAQKGAVVRDE